MVPNCKDGGDEKINLPKWDYFTEQLQNETMSPLLSSETFIVYLCS